MKFVGSKDLFGDLPLTKSAPSLSLFGDLPTTKKHESSTDDTAPSSSFESNKAMTTAEASSTASQSTIHDVNAQSQPVPNISVSGKTMSFIPTALQRKRPAPVAVVVGPTTTNTIKGNSSKASSLKLNVIHAENDSTSSNNKILLNTIPTNPIPVSADPETSNKSMDHTTEEEESPNDDSKNIFIESQQLISLHTQLNEGQVPMYDPHQPNDYLLVLQQRQQMAYKRNLEQQAQEFLQRQAELQKKIDVERKKIDQSGDYTAMIASRTSGNNIVTSGGRGRGRGSIQNLPSWLLQKQVEQQQQQQQHHQQQQTIMEENEIIGTRDKNNNQSCTVILGNIASPEEVDNDLLEEVREECEAQCGTVKEISIYHDTPMSSTTPSLEVLPSISTTSIQVTFVHSAYAEKAIRIFHGRRFGNRVITAKMSFL